MSIHKVYLICYAADDLPAVCLDTFQECVFWLGFSSRTVSRMIRLHVAVKGFYIEKVLF